MAVDAISMRFIRMLKNVLLPQNVLKTREPACSHNSRRPDAAAYRRRALISGRANLPRAAMSYLHMRVHVLVCSLCEMHPSAHNYRLEVEHIGLGKMVESESCGTRSAPARVQSASRGPPDA